MKEYLPLIRKIASRYFIPNGDRDDLIQEGMIALWKATMTYDEDKGCFDTFAQMVIDKRLKTVVRLSNGQLHKPLNSYARLIVEVEEDEKFNLKQMPIDDCNLEREYEVKEKINLLKKISWSPIEKMVLAERCVDNELKEISQACRINEKTVDNAIQRIKRKVEKHDKRNNLARLVNV